MRTSPPCISKTTGSLSLRPAKSASFLSNSWRRKRNSLADAEVALTETQQKSGLIQPGGQAQLQLETIAQTQAEISSREVQLAAMSQAATGQNPDVIRPSIRDRRIEGAAL